MLPLFLAASEMVKLINVLESENANLKSIVAALIADYRGSQHSLEFQKKFKSRIETLLKLSAII
jgi:hypothetical protein